MSNVTFITGNANKAKYFADLVGLGIKHHAADVPEIQSLDLAEIVQFKAHAAYAQLNSPVIIEDTGLVIGVLGKLPGPFIKWFEAELGLERICRLADTSSDRMAIAGAAFAYFDGIEMQVFESRLSGVISQSPLGEEGFGWNPIFIPNGSTQTLGEMNEEEFKKHYAKIKPFDQLRKFLEEIDKN